MYAATSFDRLPDYVYSDANLLSYLLCKGEFSKVQQLIEKGADLSLTDNDHMLIHIAAHYGRSRACLFVLTMLSLP